MYAILLCSVGVGTMEWTASARRSAKGVVYLYQLMDNQ